MLMLKNPPRHCRWMLYPLNYEESPRFVWKVRKCQLLSRVRLFTTPRTVALQAPLPVEFSRQEYWGGLPFPSPGDLLDPGIEAGSPALQADALLAELLGEPPNMVRLLSRIFIDTFLGKLVLGMVSEKWKAFQNLKLTTIVSLLSGSTSALQK